MKKRVLLLGSARLDTVASSYATALRDHYHVEIFDLVDAASRFAEKWARIPNSIGRTLTLNASNVVFRDPLAISLPFLERKIAAFRPDIVIVTMPDMLHPRTVSKLRCQTDTKVISVFSDHLANFGRQYFLGAEYDALFFKDKFIVDYFRHKIGRTNIFYLPQACDPTIHHPVVLTAEEHRKYDCDITVAGNIRHVRGDQLWALRGHSVKLWGSPAPKWFEHPSLSFHQGVPVEGENKCRALTGAKIALNDNHHAEISGTNKRTFEIAAIGAFQLTDTPALADVFVPEEEVAHYTTLKELVEKAAYFLKEPDKRATMAKRSHVRALQEHTYHHRWAAKMEVLGEALPEGFPVAIRDLKVRATVGTGQLRYPS